MDELKIDPTIAYDVVELPSRGIHYTNKRKTVRVAYLTASDENILSSPSFINTNTVIPELLKRKILDKDFNIDELVEEDRQAILIFLRNTSFGSEYSVQLLDPSTNKYFPHTEYLESLNIKQTEHKPDENGLYTTTLPKTGMTVQLRPFKQQS